MPGIGDVHNEAYDAVHRDMKVWVDRGHREGWRSKRVEDAAFRVLSGLWLCACNEEPLGSAVTQLGKDTRELQDALAES